MSSLISTKAWGIFSGNSKKNSRSHTKNCFSCGTSLHGKDTLLVGTYV